jgi:hypothetical protein
LTDCKLHGRFSPTNVEIVHDVLQTLSQGLPRGTVN